MGLPSKFQVSAAGGALPQWRADGRELFYVENGTVYGASADGQRFLGAVPAGGSAAAEPVTAVLNWAVAVKH